MDEGFEVLTLMQTGKARIIPLVLVDRPNGTYWETWMKFLTEHLFKLGLIGEEDFYLFKIVHNARKRCKRSWHFYKVYQSARWVGDQLVIRLSNRLSAAALVELNREIRRPRSDGRDAPGDRAAAGEERAGDLEFAAAHLVTASASVRTFSAVDRRDQRRGDELLSRPDE